MKKSELFAVKDICCIPLPSIHSLYSLYVHILYTSLSLYTVSSVVHMSLFHGSQIRQEARGPSEEEAVGDQVVQERGVGGGATKDQRGEMAM